MEERGPLLNRRGLFIRNVLLDKDLIHSMMDYACSVWRKALLPTKDCLKSPTVNRVGLKFIMPVEDALRRSPIRRND